MSRIADWREYPIDEWRTLVARDLDIVDHNIHDVRNDMKSADEAILAQLAEVKEQQKWILRSIWGVLVSLMLVLAGVVGNLIVP